MSLEMPGITTSDSKPFKLGRYSHALASRAARLLSEKLVIYVSAV